MPRTRKNPAKRARKPRGSDYHAPSETPMLPSLGGALVIPPFKAQTPTRKTFRFVLNNGVGISTAWTTSMLLDMYAIAVGGSASPVRIYNNMKLVGVKVWATAPVVDVGGTDVSETIFEYSPSLIAGFGGAPRCPYTAQQMYGTGRMAHICAVPKKNELAAQWFSAQQGSYTLWNLQCGADTIIQIDVLCVEVNGETPVAVSYTSSVTKGTIGVTNFGVTGCRSLGLENLVNP